MTRNLNHFKITAKLDEGGMRAVYRALDTRLGREVAVKVLPLEVTSDQGRLERLKREAKVLAAWPPTAAAWFRSLGSMSSGRTVQHNSIAR